MFGSDSFVAQIMVVGFNFAPKGWVQCNGQVLVLSQNTALFSLLGTTYGGDGKSNFALPDLQGRVVIGKGQGPGLSIYDLGQASGSDTVTLINSEMPSHDHPRNALLPPAGGAGNDINPGNSAMAGVTADNLYSATAGTGNMAPLSISSPRTQVTGADQAHNNLQPYLVLNYVIALQGTFPQRP